MPPFDTFYQQLTQLRDAIKIQFKDKEVILCDIRFGDEHLCKPTKY